MYDRHHFAEFHSGKLFKKDIQTLTDDEIRNYFRLYNIGAVVAFHPASIQRLQSIPGLVDLERRVGPVHLMKVNQPLSWFLQGEGKVKASLNRLEVSEVKGNEVILKYHWAEGLIGTPAVKIVPIKIYDDPIPLIKILDPPATFTLPNQTLASLADANYKGVHWLVDIPTKGASRGKRGQSNVKEAFRPRPLE